MIISHKHKYIFWKPAKVAGSSVEYALQLHCGDDDVVTPMGSTPPVEDYDTRHYSRNAELFKGPHTPPLRIKKKIGEEIWNSYFKFTIVRNPWDRYVSQFYWNIYKNTDKDQLYHFTRMINTKKYIKHRERYFNENELLADYYIRFENLEEDFREVCNIIGIHYKTLPRIRTNTRTSSEHYSAYYNDKNRKTVEKNHRKEIEYFGYSFETNANVLPHKYEKPGITGRVKNGLDFLNRMLYE